MDTSKPQGYYTCERSEMLEFIPGEAEKILDIGCGEGGFGRELKTKKRSVWGIEIMEAPARSAALHLDKVLTGSIEENMRHLPDNYFDTIVFNDVLEHLLEPEDVLKKLKPKLKVDGRIVSSIPNVRYWKNLRKLLFNKDWKYEDDGILDRTHFRFFTHKSIRRMYENAGYNVVSLQGINKTRSIRFLFFNLIFLFTASDSRFKQFACVATPDKK